MVITCSTFGINPIFCYSGLVIPSAEALVLCRHDKSICFSFQTHITKALMGICLINISLLTSLWVSAMQRFIFPGFFYLLNSSLLAFLLISFAYGVQGCFICLVLTVKFFLNLLNWTFKLSVLFSQHYKRVLAEAYSHWLLTNI